MFELVLFINSQNTLKVYYLLTYWESALYDLTIWWRNGIGQPHQYQETTASAENHQLTKKKK